MCLRESRIYERNKPLHSFLIVNLFKHKDWIISLSSRLHQMILMNPFMNECWSRERIDFICMENKRTSKESDKILVICNRYIQKVEG